MLTFFCRCEPAELLFAPIPWQDIFRFYSPFRGSTRPVLENKDACNTG